MKVKIRIKTAEGQAQGSQKKLQRVLIRNKVMRHDVYCNKANDMIIWIVEGQPRHVIEVSKRVGSFGANMEKVLKGKAVRKMSGASEEELAQLDEMLKNQTEIEIIRGYDSRYDVDKPGLWQRVKAKF